MYFPNVNTEPPAPAYTATGKPPWKNTLFSAPPPPPLNLAQLALGTDNITQHPLYAQANLPPYNAR